MEDTQNTLSGKMWKGLSQAIKGRILKGCLRKSRKPAFQCLIAEGGRAQGWLETAEDVRLGEGWTLNTGECPSVGNASTLYGALETNVPEGYYLSARKCWQVLQRTEDMGLDMPVEQRIALLETIAEEWGRMNPGK